MILFKAKLVSVTKQLTRLKLSFATKDPLDELVLAQITGTDGWLAFNEDEFKKNVEHAMAERKIGINNEGMSDSQVLRGTLFTIWNRSTKDHTFEEYYHLEISSINKHYISKYINRE